jgi:RND superfamily putative drug exporter
VAGSLTVLPATLALLGDKINKGRIPFVGRKRTVARESRVWGWLVTRVMRRPLVAVIVAGGALLALSIPALGMQTKLSGFEDMPKVDSVQTLLATK